MPAPSVTYSFSNASTSDATQINQNFTDIINGISDGTKDLSINAITCAGSATLNGNIALGNSTSDDLTITASLASAISIKTQYSFDIGTAALGLKKIYFGSNDSAGRGVSISAGAIGTNYDLTLPTGVAAGAGYVLKSTTGGVLSFASSTVLNITAKTTTYTALITDDVITCSTASAWTLTLPAASTATGKIFQIKKTSSDFNALTIDGNASETIDGSTTTTVDTQYESINIICDGSNWHNLERRIPSTCTNYTPTGAWSGPTYAGKWKRVGDAIQINCSLTYAGTPSGALSFDIPSGLTLDTTKMFDGGGNSTTLGTAALYDDSGGQGYSAQPVYNSTTRISIVYNSGTSTTAGIGTTVPFTWASNDLVSMQTHLLPIVGWKG